MSNQSQPARSAATIIGVVETIGDVKTFGEKGFQKREVIVTVDADSQYPSLAGVVFAGKNLDKAATLRVGDAVEIAANIRGRRSSRDGRVFTDLEAWSVKVTAKAAPTAPTAATGGNDDLPF